MNDPIENPPHYTQGTVELIEAIESRGWGREWCLGNAVKYLWRAGEKDDEVQDLEKALWYIRRRMHQISRELEMEAVEKQDDFYQGLE